MSQLPPEFDEYQPTTYDPQFTADISMQMNVPDRIEVAGSNDPDSLRVRPIMGNFIEQQDMSGMTVPDKIVVLGRDISVGVQHEPNLHLDFVSLPNEHMFVNLETPPRVITLDERPFPTLEDTERLERGLNGHVRGHRFSRDSILSIGPSEFTALHQQLSSLSEHVKQLEAENSRRWQRELILYPALLGYVLLRLARWLVANK